MKSKKVVACEHCKPRSLKNWILAGEDGLAAAIEEEGHVGVLLRLRDAELGHAHFAQVLAQAVVHQNLRLSLN